MMTSTPFTTSYEGTSSVSSTLHMDFTPTMEPNHCNYHCNRDCYKHPNSPAWSGGNSKLHLWSSHR